MSLSKREPTYTSAVIVDDDTISGRLVQRALELLGVQRIVRVGSMDDAASTVSLHPDLLVTEVLIGHQPCFSLLHAFACLPAPPRVVAMSRTASRSQVFRLAEYGVSAFVEKPVVASSLIRAVIGAARACQPLPGRIPRAWSSEELIRFVQQCHERWNLTAIESAILTYACSGMTRDEIAAERGVSVNTVKTHVRSILNKSGAHSMRDIVHELQMIALTGTEARDRASLRVASHGRTACP